MRPHQRMAAGVAPKPNSRRGVRQGPAWSFVAARGALQKDAPFLELHQGVVPEQSAVQLPHPGDDSPADAVTIRSCGGVAIN
jgi:hypothetical protein